MALGAFLLTLCAPSLVLAQLVLPPDDTRPPSLLAPLDPASPWHARFTAAASALEPALARGAMADWLPLFGGAWLGEADRARIATALADEAGALRRTLTNHAASELVVLGWQPPGGGDAYAALANRPEGEAILCWRPSGDASAWPSTAAEAEDRRSHACVRMTYSVRFDPPQWRAFLDTPLPPAD